MNTCVEMNSISYLKDKPSDVYIENLKHMSSPSRDKLKNA